MMSAPEVAKALAETDDLWHLWLRAGDLTECCGKPVHLPQSGLTVAFNVTADQAKVTYPRLHH